MDNLNNSKKHKVGDTFDISLPGGEKIRFCWIPPGKFRMGSRGYYSNGEPLHEVKITQGFWMAETPITRAQLMVYVSELEESRHRFLTAMVKIPVTRTRMRKLDYIADIVERRVASLGDFGEEEDVFGAEQKMSFVGHADYPGENMSWREAWKFCDWVNESFPDQLPPSFIAGLPTEAEWEYACRAGTETEFYTGDGKTALEKAGSPQNSDTYFETYPVKQKEKNAFGLYDMLGNVFEWCADVWIEEAYQKRETNCENPRSEKRLNMVGCREKETFEQMVIRRCKLHEDRVFRGGSYGCCFVWHRPPFNINVCGNRFSIVGCRPVCIFRPPEAWKIEKPELDSEEVNSCRRIGPINKEILIYD